MTQINAYLTFDGNCLEAMTFYHECFGGKLTVMTNEESPMGADIPAELKKRIMHANIIKDGLVLMASDGIPNKPLVTGDTITLSLNCSTEAEIDDLYAKLSAGGQQNMPLGDQFWGAKFGMLTDKFGMNWMLNFDRNQQ